MHFLASQTDNGILRYTHWGDWAEPSGDGSLRPEAPITARLGPIAPMCVSQNAIVGLRCQEVHPAARYRIRTSQGAFVAPVTVAPAGASDTCAMLQARSRLPAVPNRIAQGSC